MQKLILIAALSLGTAATADTPRPETVAQTLEILCDAAREAGINGATINSADQSLIINPDAGEDALIMFPDNLHRTLRALVTDDARQAEVDRFISIALQQMAGSDRDTGDLPAERLFPVLRHRDFQDAVSGDVTPYFTPFLGDMILMYVVDYPDRVEYVTTADLATTRLSLDDIRSAAFANLAAKSQGLGVFGDSIYMLQLDGFYEAAMLTQDELWSQVATQLGDDIAMVVPARDLVIFSAASNTGAVAFLIEKRDEILATGAYPLSELLYVWNDGAWTVSP